VIKKAKSNKTFSHKKEWRQNVCVGENGGPYDFLAYAFGYHEAFKRLLESLDKDPLFQDVVFYPLVYLYRHAVELYLKSALTTWSWLKETEYKPGRHELNLLYEELFRVCSDHSSMNGFDWEKLEKPILDLHELDSGEVFRYPLHKDNVTPTIQGWGLFNVQSLGEVALNCLNELENLCRYSKDLHQEKMEDLSSGF
jgi:hypothetical protein